jgi:hypothetical protein
VPGSGKLSTSGHHSSLLKACNSLISLGIS